MKCPEDGLFTEIQAQTFFITHKQARFRFWKNTTQMTLFILSALITLVSGWDATQSDRISTTIAGFELSQGHVILIMSTAVTLITAIEAFYRYGDKATTYGVMLFEFKSLSRKMCYDYEKDPELYNSKKDEYFEKYQEILASQKDLIGDGDANSQNSNS